jgi:hypothetical protein
VHALLKRAKPRSEPVATAATTKLLQIARLRPPKPADQQESA